MQVRIGRIDPKMTLFLAALTLQGCEAAAWLQGNDLIWLWALAPLVFFAVLGFGFTINSRREQLEDWDLTKPEEPEPFPILRKIFYGVTTFFISFLALHFVVANIDPAQIAFNVGAWLGGSSFGALIGYQLGLGSAEKRLAKKSE